MNPSRKRKTRSLPTASHSHRAPVSTQPRVKTTRAASKSPPDPTTEQASASNSSHRRSLRTTTRRNSEPTKPDKVLENTTTTSPEEDSETTPSNRTHNTRLRNGIHKAKQQVSQFPALFYVFQMCFRLKIPSFVSCFCFGSGYYHLFFEKSTQRLK